MPAPTLDSDGPVHVLILGSGGREHALGWKLRQSPRCGDLHFAPGNGGTARLGTNADLKIDPVNTANVDAIDRYAREHGIGLIVVGPEDPLSQGIVDRLRRSPGAADWLVFGPDQAAAKLEGDKAFAKKLMQDASVPTAASRTFTNHEQARAYAEARELPVVVKAAGLAKGKGVVVTDNPAEAVAAVDALMQQRAYGDAGSTVIIEERLTGQEVSIIALVDGEHIYVLDPTQDHKQAHEGDTGPNTGGMGAYCPTPVVDDALMRTIERDVLVQTVDALRRSGVDFQGVLYAGLMLTAGGPRVLEFNTRFGDPECQPLMSRMRGDLLDLLIATCTGRLDEVQIDWDPRPCCCVVLASGNYPGPIKTGFEITGIEDAEADTDVTVFHAGTAITADYPPKLVTAGGRVLAVCARADTLAEAQAKANAACEKIHFEGRQYRRDIGHRVL